MTNEKFRGLTKLRDECRFDDLAYSFRDFGIPTIFQTEAITDDSEARMGITALEERMQEHDRENPCKVPARGCALGPERRTRPSIVIPDSLQAFAAFVFLMAAQHSPGQNRITFFSRSNTFQVMEIEMSDIICCSSVSINLAAIKTMAIAEWR
jgi:hypothetical protein